MRSVLAARVTELIELNLALDELLVLTAPIVNTFAGFAGEFYKLIL